MGTASSCMTAPPRAGCLPEGLYGRRTPLPPSIRLSPWGVRIAGRFLASAVLHSGRASRGYWRGLSGTGCGDPWGALAPGRSRCGPGEATGEASARRLQRSTPYGHNENRVGGVKPPRGFGSLSPVFPRFAGKTQRVNEEGKGPLRNARALYRNHTAIRQPKASSMVSARLSSMPSSTWL
jgi:hypothetical protein